jgi:hypothetical protein
VSFVSLLDIIPLYLFGKRVAGEGHVKIRKEKEKVMRMSSPISEFVANGSKKVVHVQK